MGFNKKHTNDLKNKVSIREPTQSGAHNNKQRSFGKDSEIWDPGLFWIWNSGLAPQLSRASNLDPDVVVKAVRHTNARLAVVVRTDTEHSLRIFMISRARHGKWIKK